MLTGGALSILRKLKSTDMIFRVLRYTPEMITPQETAAVAGWLSRGIPTKPGLTMASIVLGAHLGDFQAPRDFIDFRDCYRLVEACPSLRNHFQHIVNVAPCMYLTLYYWDELCHLYESSLHESRKTGSYTSRLTARLSALRNQCPYTGVARA